MLITLVVHAVSLDLCTWYPCRNTSDWQPCALRPEALCLDGPSSVVAGGDNIFVYLDTAGCLRVEHAIYVQTVIQHATQADVWRNALVATDLLLFMLLLLCLRLCMIMIWYGRRLVH